MLKPQVETITPRLSEKWIEDCNYGNRPPIKLHVATLARPMANGTFEVTGQPIIFADTGRLLDGQHRLLACIEAGVPFRALVVRGVDERVFHKIDVGRTRYASGILGGEGFPYSKESTAAAIVIHGIIDSERTGRGSRTRWNARLSRPEVVEFCRENQNGLVEASSFVCSTPHSKRILRPRSIFVGIRFLAMQKNPGQAVSFFEDLVSGEGLRRGSPIIALHRFLLAAREQKRTQVPWIAGAVIKTWNSYLRGDSVQILRFTDGEKWPKMRSLKLNLHKMSFEIAETLAREWHAFCRAVKRPECIDIGPTAEDAFMLASASSGLISGGGAEINRELSESNHWMLRWRKFGYPTFQLTHSLAASLMLTDCSAVSGADFRFPFPSFLINMPYPNSPISIDGERGQSQVRWIVAHQMEYPIPEDSARLVDRLRSHAWVNKEPSDIRWMPCTMIRLIEPHGVGVFERKPLPDEDDTLESWLMAGIPIEAVHHLPSTSLDSAAARAALRLVANLSLYLDAQRQEGHDLPERRIHNPKKKKSHRRPRGIGPALPPAWILGQGIKLDPELRAAASQIARPEGQQRAEWKLQSQHVVRGHWKQQAHGPKRSLRKKIRVEPYWRGPRLSEAVLRSFTE